MVMAIILSRQKCFLRGYPPTHCCGSVGSRRLRQMPKTMFGDMQNSPYFVKPILSLFYYIVKPD
jgi:hypothetical protein